MHLSTSLKGEINRWIWALRSGNYKQGQAYLRRGDQYCCLGVKAEIDGIPSEPSSRERHLELGVYGFGKAGEYTTLSHMPETGDELIDFLNSGWSLASDIESQLMNMNDAGWTFDQIADWLE